MGADTGSSALSAREPGYARAFGNASLVFAALALIMVALVVMHGMILFPVFDRAARSVYPRALWVAEADRSEMRQVKEWRGTWGPVLGWLEDPERVVSVASDERRWGVLTFDMQAPGDPELARLPPPDITSAGVTHMSLSADGTLLAMAAGSDAGVPLIFILAMETGELTRLSSGLPVHSLITGIDWSPDKRQIVCTVGGARPSGVWIVDVADGSARVLTPETGHTWDPAWSPDGSAIACVHRARRDDIENRTLQGMELVVPCCLMMVSLTDGEARTLVGGEPVADPSWSPDGSSIAYRGPAQVCVVDVATGVESDLMAGMTEEPAGPVHWSPGGDMIALLTRVHGGYITDVVVSAAEGSWRRRLTDGDGLCDDPTWSPEGDRLAFARIALPGGALAVLRIKAHPMVRATENAILPAGIGCGALAAFLGAMVWRSGGRSRRASAGFAVGMLATVTLATCLHTWLTIFVMRLVLG